MMGKIYAYADCVLVWLGPESDESDKAMEFISRPPHHIGKWYPGIYRGTSDPKVMTALLALLNRPYWFRLWVVQEIFMANTMLFACGERFLAGSLMIDFAAAFQVVALDTNLYKTRAGRVLMYKGIRDRDAGREFCQKYDPECDLKSLIHNFGEQICFDPRDKVFGLLSSWDA